MLETLVKEIVGEETEYEDVGLLGIVSEMKQQLRAAHIKLGENLSTVAKEESRLQQLVQTSGQTDGDGMIASFACTPLTLIQSYATMEVTPLS